MQAGCFDPVSVVPSVTHHPSTPIGFRGQNNLCVCGGGGGSTLRSVHKTFFRALCFALRLSLLFGNDVCGPPLRANRSALHNLRIGFVFKDYINCTPCTEDRLEQGFLSSPPHLFFFFFFQMCFDFESTSSNRSPPTPLVLLFW